VYRLPRLQRAARPRPRVGIDGIDLAVIAVGLGVVVTSGRQVRLLVAQAPVEVVTELVRAERRRRDGDWLVDQPTARGRGEGFDERDDLGAEGPAVRDEARAGTGGDDAFEALVEMSGDAARTITESA